LAPPFGCVRAVVEPGPRNAARVVNAPSYVDGQVLLTNASHGQVLPLRLPGSGHRPGDRAATGDSPVRVTALGRPIPGAVTSDGP